MITNQDVKYKEQGKRLREIRKELNLTRAAVSKDSGLSTHALYCHEKGLTFPCLEYLRYLHNKRKVNLNYIFGGEDRMFKHGTENTPPDFGNLQELVCNMLRLMAGNAETCFSILAFAERFNDELYC